MSTIFKKLWLERLFTFFCCLLLTDTACGQTALSKNYPELNLDLTAPKNYSLLNGDELSNFLESKIRRPFVVDVFRKNGTDSYITVTETLNNRSLGSIYPDQTDYYTRGNNTLLTLRGLPLDTVNNVISVPKKYTIRINADKALIRLATDSLLRSRGKDTVRYNGKLYSHLYVTIVKNDLGAIWLTYNYEVGKLEQAIKEVYDTWGLVTFRPDNQMKRDKTDSTTVYFGKFKHLNTPEILKKDALALEKLFQKDPYRLEDKIMYANMQLALRNYAESIKTATAAINLYIQLKKSPEQPIKNEKNTNRQISSFYYIRGVALEGLADKVNARISYQKAKEMGYQLHPEAIKLIDQNN
ncbi:hypothetical protein [Pedobacter frigoris]|uniref:Tetratricopeptide repeat protein n=1 Tax=Pedobacter frigoris TaxID=2571272 RepID=A0A4U1CIU6_9SPHI|nr:hypothetical protein [Pedobacter frigoris]TKC07333.1 hypothetical protein FA047_08740 [Pedobacter frigoris]